MFTNTSIVSAVKHKGESFC